MFQNDFKAFQGVFKDSFEELLDTFKSPTKEVSRYFRELQGFLYFSLKRIAGNF